MQRFGHGVQIVTGERDNDRHIHGRETCRPRCVTLTDEIESGGV